METKQAQERARIVKRHEIYLKHRMRIEISDRQYLWWDWVFSEHMEEAVDRYLRIIFRQSRLDRNGCLWFGDTPRAKIKFQEKTLTAYRFSYAIATVIPLSDYDVMRHECDNPYCVNPRHLLIGDQKDNFRDFQATEAYGTRRELVPKWNSWADR